MEYEPSLALTVVVATPMLLVATTVASGTIAPDSSVMTPRKVAV